MEKNHKNHNEWYRKKFAEGEFSLDTEIVS